MDLQTGNYTIASKAGNLFVGRKANEDRSLRPKQVVLRPKDADRPEVSTWTIEALADGTYILTIGGGRTADINKLVNAVLLDQPPPTKWRINPQFHQGQDTYTISLEKDTGEGWQAAVSPDVGQQITIKRYIVGRSFPPTYRPQDLFVITKLD
ncbi:hypothetical protein GALMADRAFT_78837 [Galerina marginata CBS 339.88]|uniref:Ricin B lectin domain-containing protein n=1 Tax=Galerina marginata (strain CBS 339.88) TaxID=685588 RepID=A0A067SBR4_GALM3|nr:hypothetical protein GALMADRAFT_78837 [Galerina marginata CBS 339.88]